MPQLKTGLQLAVVIKKHYSFVSSRIILILDLRAIKKSNFRFLLGGNGCSIGRLENKLGLL